MKIVLDTNVIVSGMISTDNTPGQILDQVLAKRITLCVDDRILAEYQQVLLRPGWPFAKADAEEVLAFIGTNSFRPVVPPLALRLPDPDDLAFIEVAVGGEVEAIVTGNTRHFPAHAGISIPIMSPSEFIAYFESAQRY